MRLLASLSAAAFGLAFFLPALLFPHSQSEDFVDVDERFPLVQRRAPGDFYLRIMPLGASSRQVHTRVQLIILETSTVTANFFATSYATSNGKSIWLDRSKLVRWLIM